MEEVAMKGITKCQRRKAQIYHNTKENEGMYWEEERKKSGRVIEPVHGLNRELSVA
jgi:hypothetical protein